MGRVAPSSASLQLASLMQSLDNTIANVALPHIQGAVSATKDQISWVLSSYIIGVTCASGSERAQLAQLNATVTQQGAIVAYNDDFKLLMVLSIPVIPPYFYSASRASGARGTGRPRVIDYPPAARKASETRFI
jgi:hypothetical protein